MKETLDTAALTRAGARFDPLRAGFALSAPLVLGGVRVSCLGFARTPEFLAGAAFDACVVLGLWLVTEALALAVASVLANALFYPLLFGLCALVFAHAWYFDVAIERRLTVLDLSWAGLEHFFRAALPSRGLVALMAMYTALSALAFAFSRGVAQAGRSHSWFRLGTGPRAQSPSRVLALSCAVLVLLTSIVLRAERIASPLFDSAEEVCQIAMKPKVRTGAPPDARLFGLLDKSARTAVRPPTASFRSPAPAQASTYAKVIVLVMETMTAANFERERTRLPSSAFLRRERAHFHDFERYFPNNQDSRTGMLDMLFSRLIPYEAYSDEGYAGYRRLASQPSLVDRMRELSYQTAFAVAQTALEDVVGELSWDARLLLSPPQIEAARRERKLCFSPDEYEQSCEDLVLLPAVVDFVARHPRAFVYQEFIWGHAAEYNEASGKSNAAYYSGYVDALIRELSARGLADDTLIALTSDHGFRDKGRQHEREVYRIPLIFYAPRLAAARDQRLLSHTDFGLLLFEQLTPVDAHGSAREQNQASRADDNPFVLIVGPTGQGNVFAAGPEGELLLREKLGLELLVAQRGRLPLAPEAVRGLFEAYRARFTRSLSAAQKAPAGVEGPARLR